MQLHQSILQQIRSILPIVSIGSKDAPLCCRCDYTFGIIGAKFQKVPLQIEQTVLRIFREFMLSVISEISFSLNSFVFVNKVSVSA